MKTPEELLEIAWAIIANAGGGDWSKESQEWQDAAEKWRDEYHEAVPITNAHPAVKGETRVEDKTELKAQWDTVKTEDVVSYYVKGYKDGPPESYDYDHDTQKGVFVIRTSWRVKAADV